MIAETPQPPYYAVIFSSIKTGIDDEAYQNMAARMVELAQEQPGYLGHESARDGLGITVSYWQDIISIKKWKQNTEHLYAQQQGISKWYEQYKTRICLVERDYGMEKKL